MAVKRISFQLNLSKPKHKAIFDHLEQVKENDDISEYIRSVLLREIEDPALPNKTAGTSPPQFDIDGID